MGPAVLLTGMSGVGKSTALEGLAALGFETIDTDEPGWIEVVDHEPLWRSRSIDEVLDRPREGPLVLLGTVANQGLWAGRFDAVVLLTAPLDVLLQRVQGRRPSEYGTTGADVVKIARDIEAIEPRLREMATHIIDTRSERRVVIAELAEIIEQICRQDPTCKGVHR